MPADRLPIGGRLGPYRILEPLGSGGMGTVYLAERADGEIEHRVAVKVLHGRLPSREEIDGFGRECQRLAALEHPNIARLLDSGTRDGFPYLVMEHVEGVCLDRYCRQRDLPSKERLRLLLAVGEALQAAHQQLIVHRDLKPSNILVTAAGQPKLLDLGIGGMLPRDAGSPETWKRGPRAMARYASPERLRGEAVSVASDVYSLGVVLYELLADRSPYGEAEGDALWRAVVEEVPAPPSSAAPKRRIPRDLDSVVAKALRKEKEHRYSTILDFTTDLRRFVGDLPVAAMGDGLVYRLSKFLRRHRAALAIVLVLSGTVGAIAYERLERQRGLVLAHDRAAVIADFMSEVFRGAAPDQALGDELTAREVLESAGRRIDEDYADDQPIKPVLLGTLGSVYADLGLYEAAEGRLRRALELGTSLDIDAADLLHIRSDLARVLRQTGRLEEAAAPYEILHEEPPVSRSRP